MHKIIKRRPLILLLTLVIVLTMGCGRTQSVATPRMQGTGAQEETADTLVQVDQVQAPVAVSTRESELDEDGVYTSKEDVALYLHIYGKLPGNFMTKKEAKKLGWTGGSLDDFAKGMCIGGDIFWNNEGALPEDKEYHECDIDTLGKKKRGPKRMIYSDDGYIYYTEDHYESFELLYEPE